MITIEQARRIARGIEEFKGMEFEDIWFVEDTVDYPALYMFSFWDEENKEQYLTGMRYEKAISAEDGRLIDFVLLPPS